MPLTDEKIIEIYRIVKDAVWNGAQGAIPDEEFLARIFARAIEAATASRMSQSEPTEAEVFNRSVEAKAAAGDPAALALIAAFSTPSK